MNPAALFAADIAAYRRREITEAATAVLEAGHPADVVRRAAYLAGLQWDDTHPHLASRLDGRAAA